MGLPIELAARILQANHAELTLLMEEQLEIFPALELDSPLPQVSPHDVEVSEAGEIVVPQSPGISVRVDSEHRDAASAEFLLRMLRRRDETLRKVIEVVVGEQRVYLEGEQERPVYLKSDLISERTSIHRDTVRGIMDGKVLKYRGRVLKLGPMLADRVAVEKLVPIRRGGTVELGPHRLAIPGGALPIAVGSGADEGLITMWVDSSGWNAPPGGPTLVLVLEPATLLRSPAMLELAVHQGGDPLVSVRRDGAWYTVPDHERADSTVRVEIDAFGPVALAGAVPRPLS